MKRNNLFKLCLLGIAGLISFLSCEKKELTKLSLSVEDLTFSAAGEKKTFDIVCNTDWNIEITDGASWLEVSPISGTNNATINVKVTENGIDARSATLTVIAGGTETKNLKISQAATEQPVVTLTMGAVTETTIEFTAEVVNGDKIAFIAIEGESAEPISAEDIFGQGGAHELSSSSKYELSDLLAGTSYTLQVAAQRDGIYSAVSTKNFTTEKKANIVIDYTDPSLYNASNCYIINPVAEGTADYFLPIEDRINDFWSNYANSPVDISAGDWDIELIWHDCDQDPTFIEELDANVVDIQKVTSGKSQQALKVTIASDFANFGNIFLSVKQNGEILWSWHLWITDYNPDVASLTPAAGTYNYAVENGEVHRYEGAIWQSGGAYENKFIMDRNIGARDTQCAEDYGAGSLYYQYGRKEPFPGKAAQYQNGNSASATRGGNVDFVGLIQAPTTIFFGIGNNMTNEAIENDINVMWNDKNSTKNAYIKSIFDPSPLGWMVPVDGTWSDFNTTTFPTADNGRTYSAANAFYPATGTYSFQDGKLGSGGQLGTAWSATIFQNKIMAMGITFNATSVTVQGPAASGRNGACTIRAIQE